MSLDPLERKKYEDTTIDRLMDKFTEHLDANTILDKCLSKGLITEDNLSEIGATLKSGRNTQAVRDLMKYVRRSPPGYLDTFYKILNDSKASFLAPYVAEGMEKGAMSLGYIGYFSKQDFFVIEILGKVVSRLFAVLRLPS